MKSFQPDLILLDVMMPKFSGFEVCKKIKGDATTRKIMVLMVTALNELGDIERAVQAGTDDFLSKPVNKLELLKRVEMMLRCKDLTDENERLRRYWLGEDKVRENSGPSAVGCSFQNRCVRVQDRCRGEHPALTERRRGHYVRCHFPVERP